jgi:hypothetical protein
LRNTKYKFLDINLFNIYNLNSFNNFDLFLTSIHQLSLFLNFSYRCSFLLRELYQYFTYTHESSSFFGSYFIRSLEPLALFLSVFLLLVLNNLVFNNLLVSHLVKELIKVFVCLGVINFSIFGVY